MSHWPARAALPLVLVALLVAPATGQERALPSAAGAEPAAHRFPLASPALPPEHWAVRAAARAQALGLTQRYFPPQRAATRSAVAAALSEAAAAGERMPEMAPLARAWWARFLEEFGEYRELVADPSRVRPLGGAVRVGGEDLRGRMEPGSGLFHLRVDPRPLPDESGVTASAAGGFAVGRSVSVFAEPRAGREYQVPRWSAAAAFGPLEVSAGRHRVGYGGGRGGGVVLGAGAALTGVQVQTPEPVRLPGVLRHLGDVTAHTFAAPLREERHVGDPWFWSAHLGVRPHPRLEVGINRGSVFGGDSIDTRITLRSLAGMFTGILTDDFENQVVSLDFRYRLPSERVIPATLYLEWGSEDAAGAWWRVPGIVGGAYLPLLPGVRAAALGVEQTWFGKFSRKNPPWYLHSVHRGGWGADNVPLGHPLGGQGRETLVYGELDLLDARVRLDGRVFARDRSRDGYDSFMRAGNMFAPARTGRSFGGALDAALRLSGNAEARVSVFRDAGDGWREQALRADLSFLF